MWRCEHTWKANFKAAHVNIFGIAVFPVHKCFQLKISVYWAKKKKIINLLSWVQKHSAVKKSGIYDAQGCTFVNLKLWTCKQDIQMFPKYLLLLSPLVRFSFYLQTQFPVLPVELVFSPFWAGSQLFTWGRLVLLFAVSQNHAELQSVCGGISCEGLYPTARASYIKVAFTLYSEDFCRVLLVHILLINYCVQVW